MTQNITSANTSINTLNRAYKDIKGKYPNGTVILDYGCGKYNKNKEYAETCGYEWYGYDPYNRAKSENDVALAQNPEVIMCNNVLNVLENTELIMDVIKDIHMMATDGTDIYFTIYEGDKSGKGKVTTKGYQQNKKLLFYLPKLIRYFDFAIKGNVIKCRKVVV